MYIQYDEITKRVVNVINFIDPIPETWDIPTVYSEENPFTNYPLEYEYVNGAFTHVGKSQEMIDIEDAEKVKKIENSIQQQVLDAKAMENGYDNILSACSYAGFTNPFQTEGQSFVKWRGDVWAKCYQVLAEVKAGTRPEPTIEELILELPVFALIP